MGENHKHIEDYVLDWEKDQIKVIWFENWMEDCAESVFSVNQLLEVFREKVGFDYTFTYVSNEETGETHRICQNNYVSERAYMIESIEDNLLAVEMGDLLTELMKHEPIKN
jgi:hypothetical protein